MHTRTISADHLQLSLVAMRLKHSSTRWAAMSEGVQTQPCDRRGHHYQLAHPPLMTPMHNGRMATVLHRVRVHGLSEVKRTFGTGLRAMQAELSSSILKRAAQ